MTNATSRTIRATDTARAFAVLLASAAIACSSQKDERASASPAPPPAAVAGASTTGDSAGAACPMEGLWTPCAIEDRLVHAGVVLEKQPEPAKYPFFSVPGVRYHVGSADHQLLVFVYPSAQAREQDTAALDSATAAPPGTPVSWPEPPTLVVSNNLAAVILSLNDRTVERLALALSAGLPQPERR